MATKLNQKATSEVHLRRYYRSTKGGETVSEIAQKDHVDEQTVKDSIRAVELYRARHDVEHMNEAVVSMVLDIAPKVKKSLEKQLQATTVVEGDKGKKRREPDYLTQQKAVAEVRGLIQTVQPKAPNVHATQVNVGQGNTPRLATGSYVGMEDRLKTITQELELSQSNDNRKMLVQAPLQPIEETEDGEYKEVEPVESGA